MPTRRSLADRSFDACLRFRSAKTIEFASQVLIQEMASFGYDYLTCAGLPKPGQSPDSLVLLNTRPRQYAEHYVTAGRIQTDPVITELKHTLDTFSWDEVRRRRSLSKVERFTIDEGREFGMRNGLIIPLVTTTGSISLVMPAGFNPDTSPDSRAAIELIAYTGFQTLKRLHLAQAKESTAAENRLTPREREVLQWVYAGKTDEDIGTILGITRDTVLSHIKNAKRKLDAHHRMFMISEAISRGEILP